MAPIPPAYNSNAAAAISAIQRRISDVKEHQIPRLRDCKESLATQQQYNAELQEDLETLGRLVEELDDMSEDQKGDRAQRELRAVVAGLRGDIISLRKDSRAALLASKRAIDATTASKREELLRSAVMRNSNQQTSEGKITEDALMKANNDVTETMRRTLALMQGELERSVLSAQMLESSTASLKTTADTHDVLTNLLGTSKQLITVLEKTDWMDRLLILAALAFFVLVVLFILKQRIVDRGLRIAFFWTRFIPGMSGQRAAQKMDPRLVSSLLSTADTTSTASGGSSTTLTAAVSTTLTSAATVIVSMAGATGGVPTENIPPSDTSVLASSILPEKTTAPDTDFVPHDEL
ncbi:Sec20-domain-containing protein [Peniophora sp. CONT]|nr:Sec20-domain-containing protein [Peniophora sp. CONT]